MHDDWVAAEAKRAMREALGVRAKERGHTVTPPVARARPADAFDNSSYGAGDSGEHRESVADRRGPSGAATGTRLRPGLPGGGWRARAGLGSTLLSRHAESVVT